MPDRRQLQLAIRLMTLDRRLAEAQALQQLAVDQG